MKNRKEYLLLFGLAENATENDIKKAYRRLAKKYHPDLNSDPRAQQLFVDLHEAYDRLLAPVKPNIVDSAIKNDKEEPFEERRAKARERFERQRQEEKFNQELHFKRLFSSKKWKIFQKTAYFSFFFACILIIDFLLPSTFEKDRITAFSQSYNGLFDGEVFAVKTQNDREVFIKNCLISDMNEVPEIEFEQTPILHQPKQIWRKSNSGILQSFEVDFSTLSAFPFFPILFLLPYLVVRFNRMSHWFLLCYYGSFFGIYSTLAYILLNDNRIVHLLTFGFL